MTDLIRLDEILDMPATGRLAERLSGRSGPLRLDASAVAHVGGLAAQLILAAHLARAASVLSPSPGFVQGMQRLGIDPATLAG